MLNDLGCHDYIERDIPDIAEPKWMIEIEVICRGVHPKLFVPSGAVHLESEIQKSLRKTPPPGSHIEQSCPIRKQLNQPRCYVNMNFGICLYPKILIIGGTVRASFVVKWASGAIIDMTRVWHVECTADRRCLLR
ncbi:MAG: hypothetical protein M3Z54_11895 [Gemmatimonadota bacterium]|nr:hypothetical protein [Gemmatimonadota bacterium]